MKRDEQAGHEEWIAEDTLAELAELSESEQWNAALITSGGAGYSPFVHTVRFETFVAKAVSYATLPMLNHPRNTTFHTRAIVDHPQNTTREAQLSLRLRDLEALVRVELDALKARIVALENEHQISASEGDRNATGTLGWILSHPELRIRYAHQYVAIKETPNFEIIESNDNLAELLASLGDDLSGVYIHQFP